MNAEPNEFRSLPPRYRAEPRTATTSVLFFSTSGAAMSSGFGALSWRWSWRRASAAKRARRVSVSWWRSAACRRPAAA